MNNQRTANRETDVCTGVSCFAKLPNGDVLEGVMKDVSDGGARISGKTDGLSVGQEIGLKLVLNGERVGYVGIVANIAPDCLSYGARFKSGPTPITDGDTKPKRCVKCRQWYDSSVNFCGTCGSELTQPRTC